MPLLCASNMSDAGEDAALRRFEPRNLSYDLSALRYGGTVSFDIAANWKLVYENYIDCYQFLSRIRN